MHYATAGERGKRRGEGRENKEREFYINLFHASVLALFILVQLLLFSVGSPWRYSAAWRGAEAEHSLQLRPNLFTHSAI